MRVAVLTMGGTIASVPDASGPGAKPTLTADDLVAAVPGLDKVADVRGLSFRQFPSPELTLSDLFALAAEARRQVDAGARGIVVTQGTDTLEETAFALDLLYDLDPPVVITGAMRNPSLPGADGPANLLAAVQVAASEAARGVGVLVVFNDEIHAARFVRKTHTSNPATFRSAPTGPIGWVSEGRVRLAARPAPYPRLPVAEDAPPATVALVRLVLGDDPRLLDCAASGGYDGVVVEAYGGGHVPERFVAPLADLAARMPVVLASRTGSGEMLRETYGFPGGELDLLSRGLVSAGTLDGLKARLLLTLLLTRGADRDRIDDAFAAVGFGGRG
ncbi:MAG: asparaginase [Streptosporangiaceae bacterium]